MVSKPETGPARGLLLSGCMVRAPDPLAHGGRRFQVLCAYSSSHPVDGNCQHGHPGLRADREGYCYQKPPYRMHNNENGVCS